MSDRNWKDLGWRHPLWDLVRYYCSFRSEKQRTTWLDALSNDLMMSIGESDSFAVEKEHVELLVEYVAFRKKSFDRTFKLLRSEFEALEFCQAKKISVGKTATKNKDHHQSSKAMVATVSHFASQICKKRKISFDPDPQKRCVWCSKAALHVTARNLDGAVPGLKNPEIIWEIKEYWGKTNGGSKMSDAVYECNLVGRELREFEERAEIAVKHIVFVDGRDQWASRKSDLARFLDLHNQGLVDHLYVGRDVEARWPKDLDEFLK